MGTIISSQTAIIRFEAHNFNNPTYVLFLPLQEIQNSDTRFDK